VQTARATRSARMDEPDSARPGQRRDRAGRQRLATWHARVAGPDVVAAAEVWTDQAAPTMVLRSPPAEVLDYLVEGCWRGTLQAVLANPAVPNTVRAALATRAKSKARATISQYALPPSTRCATSMTCQGWSRSPPRPRQPSWRRLSTACDSDGTVTGIRTWRRRGWPRSCARSPPRPRRSAFSRLRIVCFGSIAVVSVACWFRKQVR
jgi:hypothetical protein